MNRLQFETSPYLRQHQDNPVNWYPWGEEAFQVARDADRPILLSVGYSACHWCHVMAHESFENEETARLMNEMYVNIKVDREERPDVDAIYMDAVQALTRSGGWPMTVFLLPDGRPFYGGTYFPPQPRYGMPSFRQILEGVHDAFANRRNEVEQAAKQLTQSLDRTTLNIGGVVSDLDEKLLDHALGQFMQQMDLTHGGMSGAPKFPQPMNLEFLLRGYLRTERQDVLHALTLTLYKMARGGIYDQIGGGFARYSVDAVWLVPHFEKMLYDNAQLSRLYLHAWQVTGDAFFKRTATDIYDYILLEMTGPEGAFFSATDADSEGEEGKFFVWSVDELRDLLTEEEFAIAEAYWGVTEGGNFEGKNILFVENAPEVVAEHLEISLNSLTDTLAQMRDKLYAARSHRVHPGLDDKILTAWNGMMLASLAEAARVMNRDDYLAAAIRTGEFLLANLLADDGRLLRTHKDGQSKINGYLEDYANMIDALLELYQATFEVKWYEQATALAEVVLSHFQADDGGFYDTGDNHEALIVRPRSLQDNAVPSGNSMIAKQLLRLAAYSGDSRYTDAAAGALSLLSTALQQYPVAFGEALNAVDLLVQGLAEIALVGDPDKPETKTLLQTISETWRPNTIIALAREDVGETHSIPLLQYRTMRDGSPTVYVCRNFACRLPVTAQEDLRSLLAE